MYCKNPYMAGAATFGCGQCLPCRINRGRVWTWRQFLEAMCNDHNSFVTLTYAEWACPLDGRLYPEDLSMFIRELRRIMYPVRFRFYAVGEYGEDSNRPHYHLSLFGVSGTSWTSVGLFPEAVRRAWPFGYTSVAEFNHHTAQYVAGYVVKKLVDRRDGKHWAVPEFARMSNRPGIGAPAMAIIARTLGSSYQSWEGGDVPRQLRIGKRLIPLGRYLLDRLRTETGFTEEYKQELKDGISMERSLELHAMLLRADKDATFKSAFLKDCEAQIESIEKRALIFKQRRSV